MFGGLLSHNKASRNAKIGQAKLFYLQRERSQVYLKFDGCIPCHNKLTLAPVALRRTVDHDKSLLNVRCLLYVASVDRTFVARRRIVQATD